jgi:hypothetical protein
MGELARKLDDIRVRTRAPGIDLEAELRNRNEITIEFGESVYEFVDERALERALGGLARLLWAGWQRQYREAISDTNLNIDEKDQHDINFREEVKTLEASGESADGAVYLDTVGMVDFSAEIERGILRELDEEEFAARVSEAAPLLIGDFQAKVTELKLRYYG